MKLKSLSVILLTISVFGVALFGFTMMEHVAGHEVGGCVASVGRVAPCPEEAGSVPADFLSFHLEVLKIFAASPDFLSVITALLLMLVLVALVRLKFLWCGSILSIGRLMAAGYTNVEQSVTPLEANLRQWLALHEKRDPVAALWVR